MEQIAAINCIDNHIKGLTKLLGSIENSKIQLDSAFFSTHHFDKKQLKIQKCLGVQGLPVTKGSQLFNGLENYGIQL